MSVYQTVEVPAIDLALLLDWCDMSHVKEGRGKALRIGDVDTFATAHRECTDALHNMWPHSRRYDTEVEAVVTEAAYEQEGVPHGV